MVASSALLEELNAFEAPYLIDKLVKEKMFASPAEASALFREVKRYLAVRQQSLGVADIPMFSRRVDEVWHQLVLFTVEYCDFARRFFGEYVHHTPNQGREAPLPEMTFDEFRAAYEALFGVMPVDVWRDELAVTPDTRVIRADFHSPIFVRRTSDGSDGGFAELVWELPGENRVLLRASARSEAALRFLLETTVFYVRELPACEGAALSDDDRVALCRPLVTSRVLRVAP